MARIENQVPNYNSKLVLNYLKYQNLEPIAIQTFNTYNSHEISVPIWTGIIIALGGLSCIIGGYASLKLGSHKVATTALSISGFFCLLSPFLFNLPPVFFLMGWSLWGMAVIADSPQFSNLVAQAVTPKIKGTALILVNSIGFAISIISIQLLSYLSDSINPVYLFLALSIGPIIGILSLGRKSV